MAGIRGGLGGLMAMSLMMSGNSAVVWNLPDCSGRGKGRDSPGNRSLFPTSTSAGMWEGNSRASGALLLFVCTPVLAPMYLRAPKR